MATASVAAAKTAKTVTKTASVATGSASIPSRTPRTTIPNPFRTPYSASSFGQDWLRERNATPAHPGAANPHTEVVSWTDSPAPVPRAPAARNIIPTNASTNTPVGPTTSFSTTATQTTATSTPQPAASSKGAVASSGVSGSALILSRLVPNTSQGSRRQNRHEKEMAEMRQTSILQGQASKHSHEADMARLQQEHRKEMFALHKETGFRSGGGFRQPFTATTQQSGNSRYTSKVPGNPMLQKFNGTTQQTDIGFGDIFA